MGATRDNRRIIDAAVALLAAAPGHRMSLVQLNKALFYLDLASLRDEGETLTRSAYVALNQGPVLAKYKKRLVGELERQGLARQESGSGLAKPVCLEEHAIDAKPLSEKHRELAEKVARWASRRTAGDLSELSHQNIGWQLAHAEGQGASKPPRPIDLSIAMQQLVDEDPWLDEPLDSEMLETVSRVDRRENIELW